MFTFNALAVPVTVMDVPLIAVPVTAAGVVPPTIPSMLPVNVPAIAPVPVMVGEVSVLFVRVSVDVLATSVSAPDGIVTVPPFVIEAIVGVVKVLLVSVSADTKLTNVELAPAGSTIVFVTFALCGCDAIVCPWLLLLQFNFICPTVPLAVPSPLISSILLSGVTSRAPPVPTIPAVVSAVIV